MASAPRRLHLICNAHLDPVWLWEWEEGAAAAISTFRVAADLCEKHRRFVFCHNEAVLYRWVEEYEPPLFRRIQKLVRAGRWRIMGGWWLQPDCNMPSGESFVRQILLGKTYFAAKFGVEPTTAINFDSFGHNRGLPQILAKAGYDSYLHCRPAPHECALPAEEYAWVGVDGSSVVVARQGAGYNTPLGRAHEKIERWLKDNASADVGFVLWGVGNHGGGPSQQDVATLEKLIDATADAEVVHSHPEAYFTELIARRAELPRVERSIQPFAVGCYTSQIRIKQRHRRLESEVWATEAMASAAAGQGLIAYPGEEIAEAQRDLCFAQFHDILPGSSIQPVEETSLRGMDHGLELLSRAKARAFFALAQGQPPARAGEIPILVHNPHPWPVDAEVACEFQLQDQNWKMEFTNPIVHRGDQRLPSQCEQEASNLPLDWRKRVVFRARLAPAAMNRFDCRLETLPAKPVHGPEVEPAVRTPEGLDVAIDPTTGLIARWRVGSVDVALRGAGKPLVIADSADPWGMTVKRFRDVAGEFTLLSPEDATRASGLGDAKLASPLRPVRVVEDGPVRRVVEAMLGYGASTICLRWLLPKAGTEVGLEARVLWTEKDRMLKLALPLPQRAWRYVGQIAYGADDLPANGDEAVAQQWVAASDGEIAFTAINDGTYGSDFTPDDGIRLSLLRSPAYSGHPLGPDRPVLRSDRLTPRQEQGERLFRFWFSAGPAAERLAAVDAEAAVRNRAPMALSFFPAGGGKAPKAGVTVSDPAVQLGCCKRAEDGRGWIVRVFNAGAGPRAATIAVPWLGAKIRVGLQAYEIESYRIVGKRVTPVDLLERPLAAKKTKRSERPRR